ncbi:MAG TPA: HD-GYP domain-containing protein, partial [Longimicrobiales bacterium]|nr:HD-GYP domain-containing protein [Longimicrobiales bacterium]
MSRYCAVIARGLKLPPGEVELVQHASRMHDLGKIAVPDAILLKAGPLDPAERASIQVHPRMGADLVRGLRTLDGVVPIICHHHERMDGTGYPDGLQGDAIPLGARILAVVDVFDALRTPRPYKPAFSTAQTLEILLRETDSGAWDPRVVDAFLPIVRSAPTMVTA